MLGLKLNPLRMQCMRALSTSAVVSKVMPFTMPAMSPTMEVGNIVEWKVKEGGAFNAGDLLLSIETDKATIDVEAQDDGIMGKIIYQNGATDIPVNKTIALLAEEGDDISNLEVPKEESPQPEPSKKEETKEEPSKPEPKEEGPVQNNFTRPLFPSVARLIEEYHISDAESKIKATGPHGMLTKGDILAFLGKARSPFGTASLEPTTPTKMGGQQPAKESKEQKRTEALSGAQISAQIIAGLERMSARRVSAPVDGSWDAIMASYGN